MSIIEQLSKLLIDSPLRDTYIAAAIAGISAMCIIGILLYIVIRGHQAYDAMMEYHASRENELSRRTQDK
jgi:hypothetical protein